MGEIRSIRILHLSVYRDLPSGIRRQLMSEALAAQTLQDSTWDVVALHGGALQEGFEKPIPKMFRLLLLRYFFAWLFLLKSYKKYDVVLLRHMTFDPFALIFSWFIPNRISVHHSKEIKELPLIRLGLQGQLAAFVERITGFFAVRNALAVLGVTREIAVHQVTTRSPGKPFFVYANGIDLTRVNCLADHRTPDHIMGLFISNHFSAWHGLDRLIDSVTCQKKTLPKGLVFHLVGILSDNQVAQIRSDPDVAAFFKIHGFLNSTEYQHLASRCDFGIGSLAMDRQGLNEGSTLKVRDLLAMGLPVFSGHRDGTLPPGFEFYHIQRASNLSDLVTYAKHMKRHSRQDVRSAASPFVAKKRFMHEVVAWLRNDLLKS